jgi:hypothetical protein
MGAVILHIDRVPTSDDVVSALLSSHPLGQPVSTRCLLADFRITCPASMETDDAIVASIMRVATGRTMAVVFDHRAAPEPPVMSWQPDVVL